MSHFWAETGSTPREATDIIQMRRKRLQRDMRKSTAYLANTVLLNQRCNTVSYNTWVANTQVRVAS